MSELAASRNALRPDAGVITFVLSSIVDKATEFTVEDSVDMSRCNVHTS
jgi:hypothetical protein